MSALSSSSYKGSRDYYPADKRVQNYIFSTWQKVAESFGYEEYGAPLLEPLEVYAAKSGQELVNEQVYSFVDRGDRTVAIRPEMTPTISRMVAARRQEMAYPARLYSIANFMRYERPQRGREREFWQLNVDMFGLDGPAADAEIITMAAQLLKQFGAREDMYVIRINNRNLINLMMAKYLNLDAVQSHMMVKLFDRKNKISTEEFKNQAIEIFGVEHAVDGLSKISNLLSNNTIAGLPAELKDSQAGQELIELSQLLSRAGVKSVKFDVTLMRGLDYYTGTVFEVFDTHPENNRSLFGGGRYDGLVGLFGAEPISAVGMAPGTTTMEVFLRTHNLLPELPSTTDLYVAVLGKAQADAVELAAKFRAEGVNVEVDITGRKLDKQIKTAVKKSIAHIIFVGEDEVVNEIYPFKNTATTKEEKLSFERIVTSIKDYRQLSSADDELDELFN